MTDRIKRELLNKCIRRILSSKELIGELGLSAREQNQLRVFADPVRDSRVIIGPVEKDEGIDDDTKEKFKAMLPHLMTMKFMQMKQTKEGMSFWQYVCRRCEELSK